MPRRNQEAEDAAYAQALQEEYRRDFIRRESERNAREEQQNWWFASGADSSPNLSAATESQQQESQRTRSRQRNRSRSNDRDDEGKRKKKSSKKKKSKSKSRSNRSRSSSSRDSAFSEENGEQRRRRRNRNKSRKNRSRSSSRDSAFSEENGEQQRRRRHRSGNENAGDEWPSTHQQDHLPVDSSAPPIPIPAPPFVEGTPDHPAWGDQMYGDEEYARRLSENFQHEQVEVVNYSNNTDEDYARRLQAELEESDRQQERNQRLARSEQVPATGFSNHIGGSNVPQLFPYSKDNTSASGSTEPSTDEDEIVARRIQQELADAEYAERISSLERQEAASRDVVLSLERQQQLMQEQQQPPQRSCLAKWGPIVICVAIAITVPLLYVFDVFDPSDIPFLGDLFEDDWMGGQIGNITFDEINGTFVPRLPPDAFGWANPGIGLQLEILNACDDVYDPFVIEAVANWDNGSPIDSLTLTTTKVPYESECSTVNGKLKICNGNYGDTQWRGLNEVLLSPRQGIIVSSTARLNEFYLNFESDAQKLYTSCHELGHGFGLPHWDENFFNKDLGNCMDYTQNPHKSSKPDESNFLYLAQLYGGVEVATNMELTAADAAVMAFETGATNPDKDRINDLSRRTLSGIHGWKSLPLSKSRIQLDEHAERHVSNRRLVHADEHSEMHVYEHQEHPGLLKIDKYLLSQVNMDA